jgi:hypothetical protein
MATNAGVGLVGGSLEFGFIHEQGDGVAGGVGDGECFVRVTLQAIAVF